MSNGIGRVWAVNAEGGDAGRPNGVGPVWIENADQLGSKLPEPEAGDAGKVLGVLNADGDIGWVPDQEGMAQVQADWDQTDSSQVSYIANKPSLATVATSGAYSDLSGTPTVDQVYDATSTNAQSGTAVAQAIANIPAPADEVNTLSYGPANTEVTFLKSPKVTLTIASPSITQTGLTALTYDSGVGTSINQNTTFLMFKLDGKPPYLTGTNGGELVISEDLAFPVTSQGVWQNMFMFPVIPFNPSYNAGSAITIQGSTIVNGVIKAGTYTLGTSSSHPSLSSEYSDLAVLIQVAGSSQSVIETAQQFLIDNASKFSIKWRGETYKKTIPTVDSSYNASSTNAQSGVAVAQAIAAIPSASYTAGNGIDITSDTISANLDPKGLTITNGKIDLNLSLSGGLFYDRPPTSETLTVGGNSYYNGTILLDNTGLYTYLWAASSDAETFTLTIPGGVFGFGSIMPQGARVRFFLSNHPAMEHDANESYIDVTDQLTLVEVNNETQIGACTITLPAYMHVSAGWSSDVQFRCTCAFFRTDGDSNFNGSGNVRATYAGSSLSGLKISNPLPSSTPSDADKILKVNSSGKAEWATGDVQADWTEADPSDPSYVQNKPDVLGFVAGSGISITESSSSITIAADAQIPAYNTTTDVGKVLQVTANGLEWVTLS